MARPSRTSVAARPHRPAGALAALLLAAALLPGATLAEEPEARGQGGGAKGGGDGAPSAKIVGGSNAPAGAWPFAVSLVLTDGAGSWQCGGSLIHASWVLTAAHCTEDATSAEATMGSNDLGAGTVVRASAEIVTHPDYVAANIDPDVALIRLATPAPVGDSSSSAHAPGLVAVLGAGPELGPAAAVSLAPGDALTVIGWGLTSEGGAATNQLQQVEVPLVAQADCEGAYPAGWVTATMFCAGDLANGGIDACQGDSGGPILAPTSGGHVQVGVVSWGTGCARPNSPGVYASLAVLGPWVRATVCAGTPGLCGDAPEPPPEPAPEPEPMGYVPEVRGGRASIPVQLRDAAGGAIALARGTFEVLDDDLNPLAPAARGTWRTGRDGAGAISLPLRGAVAMGSSYWLRVASEADARQMLQGQTADLRITLAERAAEVDGFSAGYAGGRAVLSARLLGGGAPVQRGQLAFEVAEAAAPDVVVASGRAATAGDGIARVQVRGSLEPGVAYVATVRFAGSASDALQAAEASFAFAIEPVVPAITLAGVAFQRGQAVATLEVGDGAGNALTTARLSWELAELATGSPVRSGGGSTGRDGTARLTLGTLPEGAYVLTVTVAANARDLVQAGNAAFPVTIEATTPALLVGSMD